MILAVIKTGGKQYKVSEGDIIKIEKIKGEKGTKVKFDKVLMVSDNDGKKLELGNPIVKGKKIEAEILEQGKARKVTVSKYKAKTRYRVKRGHRQPYTKIKIGRV